MRQLNVQTKKFHLLYFSQVRFLQRFVSLLRWVDIERDARRMLDRIVAMHMHTVGGNPISNSSHGESPPPPLPLRVPTGIMVISIALCAQARLLAAAYLNVTRGAASDMATAHAREKNQSSPAYADISTHLALLRSIALSAVVLQGTDAAEQNGFDRTTVTAVEPIFGDFFRSFLTVLALCMSPALTILSDLTMKLTYDTRRLELDDSYSNLMNGRLLDHVHAHCDDILGRLPPHLLALYESMCDVMQSCVDDDVAQAASSSKMSTRLLSLPAASARGSSDHDRAAMPVALHHRDTRSPPTLSSYGPLKSSRVISIVAFEQPEARGLLRLTPSLGAFDEWLRLKTKGDMNKNPSSPSSSAAGRFTLFSTPPPLFHELHHWHSGRALEDDDIASRAHLQTWKFPFNISEAAARELLQKKEKLFDGGSLDVLRKQYKEWFRPRAYAEVKRQGGKLSTETYKEFLRSLRPGDCAWINILSCGDRYDTARIIDYFDVCLQHSQATMKDRAQNNQHSWLEQYSRSLDVPTNMHRRDLAVTGTETEAEEGEHSTSSSSSLSTSSSQHAGKGKKGSKGSKVPKKKDQLIADNLERIAAQSVTDMKQFIDSLKERHADRLERAIAELDKKIAPMEADRASLMAVMQLLKWTMKVWKDQAEGAKRFHRQAGVAGIANIMQQPGETSKVVSCHSLSFRTPYDSAAMVIQLVGDLLRRYLHLLDEDDAHYLFKVVSKLGYSQLLKYIHDRRQRMQTTTSATPPSSRSSENKQHGGKKPKRGDKGKEKDEQSYVSDPSVSLLDDLAAFQLRWCGKLMLRNLDSRPDPRVKAFYPDAWQRRLLDVIDKEESALVVGPTSAGKTMVSLYCINRLHQKNRGIPHSSDRQILVYVSPTKALVNQMAADVYLRTQIQPAIFTREQRPVSNSYEILITVPSCLEILLMAPTRQNLIRRLYYVILDEVHQMDEAEGATWERCIRLLRCPIIGNSATVGAPQAFHRWLEKVQAPRRCHFISDQARRERVTDGAVAAHRERLQRWAHLSAFVYAPSPFTAAAENVTVDGGSSKHTNSACHTIVAAGATKTASAQPTVMSPSSSSSATTSTSTSTAESDIRGSIHPIHPVACFEHVSPSSAFGVRSDKEFSAKEFDAGWPVPTALSALSFTSRDCMELYEYLCIPVNKHDKPIRAASLSLCQVEPQSPCFDGIPIKEDGVPWSEQCSNASCASVVQTALSCWNVLHTAFQGLSPASFFATDPLLTRLHVLQWEDELKQMWCKLNQYAQQFQRQERRAETQTKHTPMHSSSVCLSSSSPMTTPLYSNMFSSLVDGLSRVKSGAGLGVASDLHDRILRGMSMRQNRGSSEATLRSVNDLLEVLLTLEKADALPAIIFCMDRDRCRIAAERMAKELERREQVALEESGELKRRNAQRQAFMLTPGQHETIRGKIDDLRRMYGQDGGHEAKELQALLDKDKAVRQLPDIDPRFRFGSSLAQCFQVRAEARKDPGSRDFWLDRLLEVWSDDHPLILALERGIAVHHGGMHKRYLDLVEVLFRERKLSVVIATGTLAMGLNMPCRTSLFFEDSRYITPVSFRQMSGRAGRRGFDVEARVVFVGFPLPKIVNLLAAALHPIRTHMHFTPTNILRFLILFHDGKQKSKGGETPKLVTEVLGDMFHKKLSETEEVAEGESETGKGKGKGKGAAALSLYERHYRASFELLYRLSLIDKTTQPIGLSGLVSHLFYHDPANLCLSFLLQRSSLRSAIIKAYKRSGMEGAADLWMMILSHLFNHMQMPSWCSKEDFAQAPNSIVLLPHLHELDEEVESDIKLYNQTVIDTFADIAVVDASRTSEIANATGSGTDTPSSGAAVPNRYQALTDILPSISSSIRSPFSRPPRYSSVQSLLLSLPPKTFDPLGIPALYITDPHGRPLRLNSYAYDFFKHGIYDAIVHVNGIRDGHCFQLLDDWKSVLRKVHQAMRQLIITHSDTTNEGQSTAAAQSSATKKTTTKKKTMATDSEVDDWEQHLSDTNDESMNSQGGEERQQNQSHTGYDIVVDDDEEDDVHSSGQSGLEELLLLVQVADYVQKTFREKLEDYKNK